MDVMIHIALIIIIGLFFFLNKHSESMNPMMIIILISFFGFLFVQQGTIEIVDYTSMEQINATHWSNSKTDITTAGLGIFNVQSFMVLVYWFFMILASINFLTRDK